jgi:probable rRNA maturation factor
MDDPPSYHSIQVLNSSGLDFDPWLIQLGVRECLEGQEFGPSNVTVLVTTDSHVRDLNQKFRGIDEATDVLTFPEDDGVCGDIAIAGPYANRQAQERGIPFQDELVLLAIHGTLHLLGLEDETESGRMDMIHRMYDVAEGLGIPRESDWGSLLHALAKV